MDFLKWTAGMALVAAGAPASHKVDWVTGEGTLRVLRSAIPNGTMLIIR